MNGPAARPGPTNELATQSSRRISPPPASFVQVRLGEQERASLLSLLHEFARPEKPLWQSSVRAELRTRLYASASLWSELRESIDACLRSEPLAVVRGLGLLELPESLRTVYTAAVTCLLGELSTSNAYDHRSRDLAELVTPSDPASRDVTYQLGECEPHSDESSKEHPEDLVLLWCVRPAHDGGVSLVWPVRSLLERLSSSPDGRTALDTLRSCPFPFGGKLRRPARVLWSSVLVGDGGIRYRRGAIDDGFDVLGREPSARQALALRELARAIHETPAFAYPLAAGELLVTANRRSLHARSDFTDRTRLLIKTRAHVPALALAGEQLAWSEP